MLKYLIPIFIATAPIAIALPAPAKSVFQLPPKPGVAQPYCIDDGQISLNRCATNWFETADFLRDKVAQNATIGLSETEMVQFIAIQKTWLDLREEHCKLAALQLEGGSAYPMRFNLCRAQLTNDRIADLQKWAPTQRPDLIVFQLFEADEQHLVRELRQGTPQLAQYQASNDLWRQYRTNHCQFEQRQARADDQPAGIFTAKPISCENRLTQLRSRQIASLTGPGW